MLRHMDPANVANDGRNKSECGNTENVVNDDRNLDEYLRSSAAEDEGEGEEADEKKHDQIKLNRLFIH